MIKRTTIIITYLLLVVPGQALAQGGMTITINSADGRTINNSTAEFTNTPISSSECEDNIGISLDIRGIDSTQTILDVWRSTGNDCSDPAQRSGDTATCESLSDANLEINGATDLDEQVFQVQEFVPCEDGSYTIYFLAVDTAMNTGDVTSYGTLEIEVDTQGPSPVTEISATDGESSIGLDWELPTDGDINHLEVYYEIGSCESTSLKMSDGATVPSGLTVYEDGLAGTTSSYDLDADAVGIETGDEVAVGIVVVDDAGNQSVLSVACGTRITTDGFCDVYATQTGRACPQDCAVTTPGRGPGAPSPGWLLAALCGVLGLRRRR